MNSSVCAMPFCVDVIYNRCRSTICLKKNQYDMIIHYHQINKTICELLWKQLTDWHSQLLGTFKLLTQHMMTNATTHNSYQKSNAQLGLYQHFPLSYTTKPIVGIMPHGNRPVLLILKYLLNELCNDDNTSSFLKDWITLFLTNA